MNNNPLESSLILYTPTARILGHRDSRKTPWRIEVTLRGVQGVHFRSCEIVAEYPSLERARADTIRLGIRSPRPFVLGSAHDVSARRCAIALADDFLAWRKLDAMEIFGEAYRTGAVDLLYADIRVVIRQAEWEGMVYPETWDAAAIQQLINTLRACGEDAIADLIEDYAR